MASDPVKTAERQSEEANRPLPRTSRRLRRRRTRRGRGWRTFFVVLVLAWTLLAVQGSAVSPADTFSRYLDGIIAGQRFGIVAWEAQAITEKIVDTIRYPVPTLGDLDGSRYVQRYIEVSLEVNRLDDQLDRAYAALPADADPSDEIRRLEDELAQRRVELREMQPKAERILERQLTQIVIQEGLVTAGIVWPPVLFHFTPLPLHLVISPREEIRLLQAEDLKPDLSLVEIDRLEDRIRQQLDVSALVDNLGGYGAYPTMVLESASLTWLTDVVAHEWIHNYLVFHPLGLRYSSSNAMRTINETVASLTGQELGAKVLEKYYPWVQPPPLDWQAPIEEPGITPPPEDEPQAFEFGTFMRVTRLETERLLEAGEIETAEDYMEMRRQILVSHGYYIRKLNQAYFAFHGLYATSPGAVDPIGDKLTVLRRESPSLQDFMTTVSAFSSPEDLDRALSAL